MIRIVEILRGALSGVELSEALRPLEQRALELLNTAHPGVEFHLNHEEHRGLPLWVNWEDGPIEDAVEETLSELELRVGVCGLGTEREERMALVDTWRFHSSEFILALVIAAHEHDPAFATLAHTWARDPDPDRAHSRTLVDAAAGVVWERRHGGESGVREIGNTPDTTLASERLLARAALVFRGESSGSYSEKTLEWLLNGGLKSVRSALSAPRSPAPE